MKILNDAGNLTYITEVLSTVTPHISYTGVCEAKKLGVFITVPIVNSSYTQQVCLFEYSGALNLNGGIIKEGKYPHQLTVKAQEYFSKWLELKKIEFLNYIQTA